MSILIKGMDLPQNCFMCPLSVLSDERLYCELTSEEVLRAKIDSGCPLIELPPHGRLIDADAFERGLKKFNVIVEEDLQDVIYALRDYPAIIEAEE